MSQEIWTIKDVLSWSAGFLEKSGSESPKLDAELLLCEALRCRRLDLYMDYQKPLIAAERQLYKDMIRRRAQGEPVAYITGRRDFFGLPFQVSAHTLIPRPDTETLLETVFENYPKDSVLKCLDIGTGTGCIAITLKHHRASWDVEAWDVSDEALAVARSNAALNKVELAFEKQDALAIDQLKPDTLFDVIVSNPPYIARTETDVMSSSTLKFEPHAALFADENGLAFYAHFAQHLPKILKPGGKVFLEIGYRQKDAVCSLLEAAKWTDVRCLPDLTGHDRVVLATAP